MTTQLDQGWTWETAGPVSVPRLGAWQRLSERGAALVLAHPEVPEGTFRPNLVVRLGESGGASLALLATRAVISSLRSLPGAHVVGHEEATLGGHPARRQKITYEEAGQAVCAVRWLCVIGGLSLEITCSFAPEQLLGMEPLLHRMVSLATVEAGPTTPPTTPPAGAPAATGPEPVLDRTASEHLGRPLEDLSRIAAVQPFVAGGHLVGDEALALLMSRAEDRVGAVHPAEEGPLRAELVAAGLLDATGVPTTAGQLLLAPLRERTFSFTVGASRADLATSLTAWVGPAGAFLVSGPAPAGDPATPALGRSRVQAVNAASLPALIVSWLGVGPAWSYTGEHLALTAEAFARRLENGPVTSPPGRDPGLVRMWREPWLAWSLQDAGSEAPASTWLSAGTAGQHLVFVNGTGGVELEPFQSAAVWSVLARHVHDGMVRLGAY